MADRDGGGSNRSLSFWLLCVFQSVAEKGGLSAASRSLGVSVSSVSRDIMALERELGVRLFERSSRSLVLTEAGASALHWAEDALKSRRGLAEELANLTGRAAGMVKLAVNHYVAVNYLPAILTAFCRQYPEITVSVETTDGDVDMLREGVDVMIQSGRPISDQLIGVRIDESHRVLCATADYLERHGSPRTPSDLDHHRLLVHSTNEAQSWGFRRGKQLLVVPIKPYVAVDNYLILHDLALRGVGIARLGRGIVWKNLKCGKLRPVLQGYAPAYAQGGDMPGLWVFYPSRHLVMRVRVFVDFLISALRNRHALE